jgi:hypothetical protein
MEVRPTSKALYLLSTYFFFLDSPRVWVIWARSYFIVAVPFLLMVLASGD